MRGSVVVSAGVAVLERRLDRARRELGALEAAIAAGSDGFVLVRGLSWRPSAARLALAQVRREIAALEARLSNVREAA